MILTVLQNWDFKISKGEGGRGAKGFHGGEGSAWEGDISLRKETYSTSSKSVYLEHEFQANVGGDEDQEDTEEHDHSNALEQRVQPKVRPEGVLHGER